MKRVVCLFLSHNLLQGLLPTPQAADGEGPGEKQE